MNVEQAKKAEKKMNKKYKNYSKLDMARMYSEKYGIVLLALNKNSKNPYPQGYKSNTIKNNENILDKIEKEDVNYGLLAQEESFMLDVDLKDQTDEEGNFLSEKEAIERWNNALKKFNIPKTLTQKTTNGKGQHYIFKVTKHMKETLRNSNRSSFLNNGIWGIYDPRHTNGYVVGAKSTLNGKEYKIIDDSKISDMPNDFFDYLWAGYNEDEKKATKNKKEPKKQTPKKQSPKKQTPKKQTPKADKQPEEEQQPKEETESSEEVELYQKLLNLIEYKYVDNYHTAISIIWSARSESEDLKEATHEVMSKSNKYTRE